MATLYVSEFSNLGLNGNAPFVQEPAIANSAVTFTSATQSAVFGERTTIVKLVPSDDCRVAFGANPTAVASSEFLAADQEVWRGVQPGHRLSVYDGSS